MLSGFKNKGGSLIVDCTPYGCGRGVNALYELSRTRGVKIISVTGFHKKQYYLNDSIIWNINRKQAHKFFLDEVQKGFTEAKDIISRPGAVKVAYIGVLKDQYLNLTLAALKTAKETGIPLIAHTEKGQNAEDLVNFLEEQKMDMSRVLLCHMDKNNDKDLHKKLIEKGVFLEYDTFLKPKYDPESNVMPLLKDMVQEGYGDKILLGSDIDSNTMWRDLEDSGRLEAFFKNIKKELSGHQIKNDQILPLMGLNAINFFNLEKRTF